MPPYARLIRNVYVVAACRFVVAMLKIHCWLEASHRNAASGTSFTAGSFSEPIVPLTAVSIVRAPVVPPNTAAGLEIELPDASHTRNFTGIVLPPLRW